MACLLSIVCIKCKRNSQVMVGAGSPTPTVCKPCQNEIDDLNRKLHFEGLDSLPLEERIRKIEEWIYNHKSSTCRHDIRF